MNEIKQAQSNLMQGASAAQVSRRDFLRGVFSVAALAAAAGGAYIEGFDERLKTNVSGDEGVKAKFFKRADELAG